MTKRALRLYAGPAARRHIAQHGLRPADIGVVAGAAGGPKGLILGPLDRFVFGQWLAQSAQPVDLVGASIGAWRMATACLSDAVPAFERLEHDYIRQHYALQPGEKRPPADRVSALFAQNLQSFFGGQEAGVLAHPRYRLHIVTAHGRHMLRKEHAWRTPLGYLGAFLSNAVHRRGLGAWLERVVFSTAGATLPFASDDFPTRQVGLTLANFQAALQASCAIPFVLRAVQDIPGAPPGAYCAALLTAGAPGTAPCPIGNFCAGGAAPGDAFYGGILSANATVNPRFHNYSLVFIHCACARGPGEGGFSNPLPPLLVPCSRTS
jgi:hypothetical protein